MNLAVNHPKAAFLLKLAAVKLADSQTRWGLTSFGIMATYDHLLWSSDVM